MGLLITVLRLAIYSGLMGVMMPMISMTIPNCCSFKYLSGPPDMEGNYTLIHPEEVYNDVLPEECRDSCVYTKQGNYEDQFCFEATDPEYSPSFSQCQAGPSSHTTAGLYTTSSPAKESSGPLMTTTSTGQIPVEITTTPSGQSPVEITTTTPSGQSPVEITTTTPSGQSPVEMTTTTPSGQSPVEISTTTPSGQIPNVQCLRSYSVMNESWRKIMYGGSNETTLKCDRSIPPGWYRFMEPAGVKLPLTPPESYGWYLETCGTAASAWVQNGTDPVLGKGVLDINICFAFTSVCQWSIPSKAVACSDSDGTLFYLYHLQPVEACWLAYCALENMDSTTATSTTTSTASL